MERFFTLLQQSGLGAEEHTLKIGEQLCLCQEGCYYLDGDYLGKISSLINAFSKFDTVKLSDIYHHSYITEISVLNSNRLYVSFRNDYDSVGPCIQWLNHKSPNSSLPQRELYVDVWCGLRNMRSLLLGLISVGFLIHTFHLHNFCTYWNQAGYLFFPIIQTSYSTGYTLFGHPAPCARG